MALRIAALAVGFIVALAATILALPAAAQPVPNGSYLQSCRNIQVQNGQGEMDLLLADCRDNAGRWRQTGLRYRTCPGDIANQGGQLVCGQGYNTGGGYNAGGYEGGGYNTGGYGQNQGGYSGYGSLRLYDQFALRGQTFDITTEITNLPRYYNDRARSLAITGRGTWQICADSDFRGRCVMVTGKVRDLRSLGMADTISSIRQVR